MAVHGTWQSVHGPKNMKYLAEMISQNDILKILRQLKCQSSTLLL